MSRKIKEDFDSLTRYLEIHNRAILEALKQKVLKQKLPPSGRHAGNKNAIPLVV